MNSNQNFPSQKLPRSKKNKDWYKECADSAQFIIGANTSIINTWRNRLENYNLSLNILDVKLIERAVDPKQLGLASYPVDIKHIGIGNTKLNLLLGDYIARRFDWRFVISNKDEDSISRKEEDLKRQLFIKVQELIAEEGLGEEEMAARLEKIQEWMSYDYQDIAEMTANAIITKEYKEKNFPYIFMQCFKYLLNQGACVLWLDTFGKEPNMRVLNPLNVYSFGGNTNYIHEKDVIVIEDYKSIGQIYDDYWDDLTEKDRETLEHDYQQFGYRAVGYSPTQITVDEVTKLFGNDSQSFSHVAMLLPPEVAGFHHTTRAFNAKGHIRELTVIWKSRRKIGVVTFINELGMSETMYVSEDYVPDKFKGETVKWLWINEYCRTTKIGNSIYVRMGPVEASAKSFTNLSTGLPPIIGLELEQSLYDIIKPMDLAYDVAYWKRSMLVSTYRGTRTAVNASAIPNGWEPQTWFQYSDIDGYLLFDPTQEIVEGPMTGKTVGAHNWVTQEVKGTSNDEGIRLLTEYMSSLEETMGKISGVHGAREGDVGERSAVRNNQFEIAQFTKITEHWFMIEQEFRRIAMKKYLEVCKLAYKNNPQKGTYVLGHLGQAYLKFYNEFAESEFDLHLSNGREDTELFNKLQSSIDQAIAQGKGALHDLVTISSSNSVQKITRELRKSAEQVFKQQQQLQAQQEEAAAKQQMAMAMEAERAHERAIELKQMDVDVETYKADKALEGVMMNNQTKLILDSEKEEEVQEESIDPLSFEKLILEKEKAEETKRHNMVTEKNDQEKIKVAKIQKKTAPKK